MAERSKVLAWKASMPHKGIGGSNPFFSAIMNLIKNENNKVLINLTTNYEKTIYDFVSCGYV